MRHSLKKQPAVYIYIYWCLYIYIYIYIRDKPPQFAPHFSLNKNAGITGNKSSVKGIDLNSFMNECHCVNLIVSIVNIVGC